MESRRAGRASLRRTKGMMFLSGGRKIAENSQFHCVYIESLKGKGFGTYNAAYRVSGRVRQDNPMPNSSLKKKKGAKAKRKGQFRKWAWNSQGFFRSNAMRKRVKEKGLTISGVGRGKWTGRKICTLRTGERVKKTDCHLLCGRKTQMRANAARGRVFNVTGVWKGGNVTERGRRRGRSHFFFCRKSEERGSRIGREAVSIKVDAEPTSYTKRRRGRGGAGGVTVSLNSLGRERLQGGPAYKGKDFPLFSSVVGKREGGLKELTRRALTGDCE